MSLPTTPSTSWMQGIDLPSRLFGTATDEYELYEEDDQFVLTVEMPGYDEGDIDLTWYDGRLNIAAERADETRNRKKTFHRTFRFPKEVDEDTVEASYENGVLEVVLPVSDVERRGTIIPLN